MDETLEYIKKRIEIIQKSDTLCEEIRVYELRLLENFILNMQVNNIKKAINTINNIKL